MAHFSHRVQFQVPKLIIEQIKVLLMILLFINLLRIVHFDIDIQLVYRLLCKKYSFSINYNKSYIIMFVKRINKIYAPSSNGSRNNNLTKTKKMVESKKQQAHYVDDLSRPFKVITIECDPHGALIALYSQQSDAIYIVSILTLLEFVDKFRSQFAEDGQYSFKTCLKPDLIITNPRPSLNVFIIKFSHRVQNTQLLTVAYYNGVIDIYSVVTGKKVDGLDLMQKSLHLGEEISPIYNVNILGHSLFISTYDGRLLCYEGHQLTKCTKYKDEWVRLSYAHIKQQKQHQSEEEQHIDENQSQNEQAKDKKKGVIYQDKNNKLILGGSQIRSGPLEDCMKKMKQKQKEIQKQVINSDLPTIDQNDLLSESYKQYLRLQTQKMSYQNSFKPFIITACERFIVCNIPISFIYDKQIISTEFYTIRLRNQNWRIIKDINFVTFPYINHFWGIQSDKKSNLSEKKKEKMGFHKFFIEKCKKSKYIMIAVIGDYETEKDGKFVYAKQTINEKVITILRIGRKKYVYYSEIICKLTDIKDKVVSISWIGPNMLLYLEETGNVYYMQIDPQMLIK